MFGFNTWRTGEPFSDAYFWATMPDGLLGRIDPAVYQRLVEKFGKPTNEWNLEDWQFAARVLGFYVGELLLEQHRRSTLAQTKKRGRGRPRKLPAVSHGLLGPIFDKPAKRRGAKVKFSDDDLKKVLEAVAEAQELWNIKNGRGAIKSVLTRILECAASKKGTNRYREMRRLPYLQKLHSKAKRKFPNFPK